MVDYSIFVTYFVTTEIYYRLPFLFCNKLMLGILIYTVLIVEQFMIAIEEYAKEINYLFFGKVLYDS